MRECVEYDGEKFWLQTTSRYFQSGDKTKPERLLHRRIWTDNNGAIPDGYAVHHIDGDWRNNDLSNLTLMPIAEHMRVHMLERWSDPDSMAKMKVGLEKAREAAKAWHSSEEGLQWHSQNGKMVWQSRRKVKADVQCQHCGSDILTFFPTKTRFCSRKCSRNNGYRTRFTLEKNCACCGTAFAANRYKPAEFCSRRCAIHSRHIPFLPAKKM